MKPFKVDSLPKGLSAEVLTGFGKPTLVLRGDTRLYREIIRENGGKFWAKARDGREDPRWTISGDRAIRSTLKALSRPDGDKIAAAQEADIAIAARMEVRNAFAKALLNNRGALWERAKGKRIGDDEDSYYHTILTAAPDLVYYRLSGNWGKPANEQPIYAVSVWPDSRAVRDVRTANTDDVTQYDSLMAAHKAACLRKIEQTKLNREAARARAVQRVAELVAQYGRVATGPAVTLTYRGQMDTTPGRVFRSETRGWLLILGGASEYVSAQDIEAAEDMDNFGGRKTPGYQTHVEVVPVEPNAKEAAQDNAKVEAAKVLAEAKAQELALWTTWTHTPSSRGAVGRDAGDLAEIPSHGAALRTEKLGDTTVTYYEGGVAVAIKHNYDDASSIAWMKE